MTNDHSESRNIDIQTSQPPRQSPVLSNESRTGPNHPQPNLLDSSLDHTNNSRAEEPLIPSGTHAASLRHIRTLETRNAKLYQDNCKLVHTINMLNDRLAFFGAPQNMQLLHFSVMQEKLRASDENLVLINQKHQELLRCVSEGSVHHHVYAELRAIQDAYASLNREYRVLRDKYARLKAVADTTRTVQQQPQGTVPAPSLAPIVIPAPYAHDQCLNNSALSMSVVAPCSLQPLPDQRGNHRRYSSESVMTQTLFRSGPTSFPTSALNMSRPGGQISPTGLPAHALVPPGSLPLLPRAQMSMAHDPQTTTGEPCTTTPPHILQPQAATCPAQGSQQIMDVVSNEPAECNEQNSNLASLESSSPSLKRSISDLQTSGSPGGECKKPRTKGDSVQSTIINIDHSKTLFPPASASPDDDHNSSEPCLDLRSYEDRVNLIFEKDADVENGVFCGLCFDRYEAKMIPEPPDVLVQPDIDSLVMHCKTTHPAVWDDLRCKV